MALQLVDENVSPSVETEETWEDLLHLMKESDELVKLAQEHQAAIKQRAMDRLREEQHKSVSRDNPDDPDTRLRVTYSVVRTVKVNEEGLKKALGARNWAKFTTAKFDKAKLEQALQDNLVDSTLVAQHTTIDERPQVRFYVVKRKDTDDVDELDRPE